MHKQKRLLAIRLSALGDVAMTVPAIYSLARQYPDLTVSVLTRPFFARLFINRPANVEVIQADFKGEHKGVRGMGRLLRVVRRLHPDYVADLHNVMRSWEIDAWMKMRGVKVAMVSKKRSQRRRLLAEKIAQENFVDRYADVFARLGFPIELTFRSLFDQTLADSPFEPDHPAVGIAPFARYYNKTYPPEMMRRVVEMLSAKGFNVYLFGGRGREEAELSEWAGNIARTHCVAGQFPIEKEIALMSRMDVMVSMDSANQHLASLAGTTVVSVWGSTTPACGFLGYGQSADNAIVLNLDCQPCTIAGSPTCPLGHLDCLCRIAPTMIVEKVTRSISKQSDL